MALEVDLVAATGSIGTFEEVVEADFYERGRRAEGGDMPADAVVLSCWPERPWPSRSSGPGS